MIDKEMEILTEREVDTRPETLILTDREGGHAGKQTKIKRQIMRDIFEDRE